MALSIFSPSVSGLNAQSHALETVSMNLANVSTTGYKSAETLFYTMLGNQPLVRENASGLSSSRVDVNGVGYYDRTSITVGGTISSTGNPFDVAIEAGSNAFFAVKNSLNQIYYSRAGDFSTRSENGTIYLVNSSGYYVQGFEANEDGTFNASLTDLTIKYPESIPAVETTQMEISANVPADVDNSSYGLTFYGPNNQEETVNMLFQKVEGQNNVWNVSFNMEGGTVTPTEPLEVVFDEKGGLLSPKTFNVNVTWPDGSTSAVAMDISPMTQYAGSSEIVNVSQDGRIGGDYQYTYIDSGGVIQSKYTNGETIASGKVALVGFSSPENLIPINGTLFEASNDAGESYFVVDSTTNDNTAFRSESLESSNVDPSKEFSNLIIVQRAYNLNGTAFTTANEMTQTAVNLKS